MCQELQIFAFLRKYVFGCKLSFVRLCDSDSEITPVDAITIGITCVAFCFHIAHISFAIHYYYYYYYSLQKTAILGTSHIIHKVLRCEA